MAVGFYTLTAAADPQTVCTALEAEAGITAAEALGDVGETGSGIFESATAAVNDVGDIDASQTTITYDTLVGSISTNLPVKATIDSEKVLITSFTSTVLTVERGIDGTVAAAHLNDAAIAIDGEVLPQPNHVIFRIVGGTTTNITDAVTAVGGLEAASGYPAVA